MNGSNGPFRYVQVDRVPSEAILQAKGLMQNRRAIRDIECRATYAKRCGIASGYVFVPRARGGNHCEQLGRTTLPPELRPPVFEKLRTCVARE